MAYTHTDRREVRSDELGALLEASLEAVVGMDEHGHIREWNTAAEAMFGWTRREALGRTVAETIVPPRLREAHEEALSRYRTTRQARILGRRVAITALHKDGRELPVELRITPIASGASRFIAFITDLTEVKRLETMHKASLASSESQRRLLETILTNTPAGIALVSRKDFIIEFLNPAFELLSPGRSPLGRSALEVWPEIAGELEVIFRRVFETRKIWHAVDQKVELRARPDGPREERWFTFDFVPVGDSDALLAVATETTDDVVAKRQIEHLADVARRRATELRGIIDHMTDAVFVSDAHGNLTLVNTAGAALVRSTPEDLEGRSIDELAARLRPLRKNGAGYQLPLSLALGGQPMALGQMLVQDPAGGEVRVVRSRAAPILDARGALLGAVEVARDLTDVERLDRLKGEFVRVAAHALNTPIAVITGYAQALAPGLGGLPQRQREMLSAMQRGIERMQQIVRDLSYVTSIELDNLELTRVRLRADEVVRSVVTRAVGRTPADVRIELSRVDPATIEVDREGLEQTLHNLVSNALRYANRGTTVEISLEVEDGAAVISVRDHGAGIAPERQAHIFERFFRAHVDTPYDFEGLGIGLYISREIVSRQGGRMWFESVEGEGSVFHVSFPLVEGT